MFSRRWWSAFIYPNQFTHAYTNPTWFPVKGTYLTQPTVPRDHVVNSTLLAQTAFKQSPLLFFYGASAAVILQLLENGTITHATVVQREHTNLFLQHRRLQEINCLLLQRWSTWHPQRISVCMWNRQQWLALKIKDLNPTLLSENVIVCHRLTIYMDLNHLFACSSSLRSL